MNTLSVIGTQWGDEGKGKIVDYFAQYADMVVRFQGGNNAGHSIQINEKRYALHLLPSGVLTPKCENILAGGMVIDLKALCEELAIIEQQVATINIKISDRAHIVMPYHRDLDEILESTAQYPVGTTKKGIGPAYTFKAKRQGIRIIDLFNQPRLYKTIRAHLKEINPVLQQHHLMPYDTEKLLDQMKKYKEIIAPYVTNTAKHIEEAILDKKKILFEGAQGTMLCLDHGTYPFVTSSSPTAAGIPLACGISPKYVSNILGVGKAYITRVGEGVFPTEINDEIARKIRKQGNEFGTTTGRPRRIGWFDAVVLKHAKRTNGLDSIAVTLLDVLKDIHPLKICIAYELDGQRIDEIPASIDDYARCKPIYKELSGFNQDISSISSYDDLPNQVKIYLDTLATVLNIPVSLISIGPRRDQTIMLKKIF